MSKPLTKEQLTEKLLSLFGNQQDRVVSIPRIIKLKEKMLGVIHLENYRES